MSAHEIIDEIVYNVVKSKLEESEKREIFFHIRRLRVLVDPRIKQKYQCNNVFETDSNSLVEKVLCKE